MSAILQEIIAFAIVLSAVIYLLRHWFWKNEDAQPGCGSCNNCESDPKITITLTDKSSA